jgi:uncharacterized protein DUF6010
VALAIIMVWYVGIGALAAAGSMYLSHRFVRAKHEATLYGSCLIAIAAIYLAFRSYFGEAAAGSLEAVAVLAFAVAGCLGTRVPVVLIAGYVLHGGWDLLHEVQAHLQVDVFGGRQATRIPLAYGAFCATFDWVIAVYFVYRRRHWVAAWKSRA